MKFKFVFSSSLKTISKGMRELSDMLELHFKDKDFGNDISNYLIGIICVEPKFDSFFKPRKPKYIGEKKEYVIDGVKVEVERTLECDIKIDYEKAMSQNKELVQKDISFKILDSITDLMKIKRFEKLDFRFEEFYEEVQSFLTKEGIT